jgi:hypothetical protein
MQADPGTNRTALQALTTVATSEYGALYVDATGSVLYSKIELLRLDLLVAHPQSLQIMAQV